MICGMTTSTFMELHVALSLVGIACGLIVMIGLLRGRDLAGWTAIFLLSLLATSVTGFAFPVEHLLPSHKVGIVSLVVLSVAALGAMSVTSGARGGPSTWSRRRPRCTSTCWS